MMKFGIQLIVFVLIASGCGEKKMYRTCNRDLNKRNLLLGLDASELYSHLSIHNVVEEPYGKTYVAELNSDYLVLQSKNIIHCSTVNNRVVDYTIFYECLSDSVRREVFNTLSRACGDNLNDVDSSHVNWINNGVIYEIVKSDYTGISRLIYSCKMTDE